MKLREIFPGVIVQHMKGGTYEIIGIGKHSETQERMVLYRDIDSGKLWTRPLTMFRDPGRFTAISFKPINRVVVFGDFYISEDEVRMGGGGRYYREMMLNDHNLADKVPSLNYRKLRITFEEIDELPKAKGGARKRTVPDGNPHGGTVCVPNKRRPARNRVRNHRG